MSNIIRLNENAPNDEWIVMSNQGTDCFLDLLIIAADGFEKTEQRKKLISFLKDQKGINDIAPGTAGFDLDEIPWQESTLNEDIEFLILVAQETQKDSTFRKLPYKATEDIVLPWLKRFALLISQMKVEKRGLSRSKKMPMDIQLRSIHNGDQENVQKMFTEFNASEFGKYDPIENTDDAHVLAFLENMVQNHVIYAITPASSDEMIGYVCFHIVGEEYDIGYMILFDYHGSGIATAASKMAIDKVREERGAWSFTAMVASENVPSVRVLEKLGFSLVSEKRIKKEENGSKYFITERRYKKRFSDDV